MGRLCNQKKNPNILVRNFRSHETRNESSLRLIQKAIICYGVNDFDWLMVNTGDRDHSNMQDSKNCWVRDDQGRVYPLLAYSTSTKQFVNTIPDFVFDHWKQTGLEDYEKLRKSLSRFDFPLPSTQCLGWRGALTHESRKILVGLDDKINFDCEFIEWDRTNPSKLIAKNFMSYEEQAKQWRYFIDMRGVGYSGRLKLLLSSRRVVFLQERDWEEFFFPFLKPWVHYVPVKADLANLEENLSFLKSRPDLESEILKNASDFAQTYLTRDYAIYTMAQVLQDIVGAQ